MAASLLGQNANSNVRRTHADTIIEDVENYLFSKPGDLQKYISNALVQCASAPTLVSQVSQIAPVTVDVSGPTS